VVGLGNPGERYSGTRHNIGFAVVDRLARKLGAGDWRQWGDALVAKAKLGEQELLLLKPLTYMNLSGHAVKRAASEFGLDAEGFIVVHDDLDLEFGVLRIKEGGGHGGHNGIRSIKEELESGDFVRLKLGIGRPPEGVEIVDHVLGHFSEEETPAVEELLTRGVGAVEAIILDSPLGAMQRYHTIRKI
jgi:PTH1 family peptidyl-tRNA hydrolase